jgi:hypothetical protein
MVGALFKHLEGSWCKVVDGDDELALGADKTLLLGEEGVVTGARVRAKVDDGKLVGLVDDVLVDFVGLGLGRVVGSVVDAKRFKSIEKLVD